MDEVICQDTQYRIVRRNGRYYWVQWVDERDARWTDANGPHARLRAAQSRMARGLEINGHRQDLASRVAH